MVKGMKIRKFGIHLELPKYKHKNQKVRMLRSGNMVSGPNGDYSLDSSFSISNRYANIKRNKFSKADCSLRLSGGWNFEIAGKGRHAKPGGKSKRGMEASDQSANPKLGVRGEEAVSTKQQGLVYTNNVRSGFLQLQLNNVRNFTIFFRMLKYYFSPSLLSYVRMLRLLKYLNHYRLLYS